MKEKVVMDLEVYKDYFLAAFSNIETGNVRNFEMFEGNPLDAQTIKRILLSYQIITFNGWNYDLPLLLLAVRHGTTNEILKRASDSIIVNNYRGWQFLDRHNLTLPKGLDHIDLYEVAPGIASLKIYGGRLHCEKMQDLPYDPSASIGAPERELLKLYNINDLKTTTALYEALKPQIALRERMSVEYKTDLRSKSDAQIAETVIAKSVAKHNGTLSAPTVQPGISFKYKKPNFISFTTAQLRDVLSIVLNAEFVVPENNQNITMPKELSNLQISIGNSTYQLGIGGLHSTEQCVAYQSTEDMLLVDRDVSSYYPTIILNQGLAPSHMGEAFTLTYRNILTKRLEAKKSGDKTTADSLKITVNGSFGKFGSSYSKLFSPDLMIQTTITGQLCLLMLIEALEHEGIPVVSANTDGVVIFCPVSKAAMMEFVVWEWETKTNFETDATYYKALYSRDVNSYIAIRSDGSVKRKGVYAIGGLQKNPTNEICVIAVTNYLRDGTSIEKTICECQDIRRFVTVRTVRQGALKDDQLLGKAIRWYYASGVDGVFKNKANGYKIPRTEGAKPTLDLPEQFPSDVNFDWYIQEAYSILQAIGAVQPEEVNA